jgi:hypothetical protein
VRNLLWNHLYSVRDRCRFLRSKSAQDREKGMCADDSTDASQHLESERCLGRRIHNRTPLSALRINRGNSYSYTSMNTRSQLCRNQNDRCS